MNFNELNLIQPIANALKDTGYSTATPIQAAAIPQILGGNDLIGCAQTGTGKTAAFAIPILQRLHTSPNNTRGIKALILTPTRELALQIEENILLYGKYLKLNCLSIYGGTPAVKQIASLKRGTDLLIATPGRLLDLMNQGHVNLSKIEILVLDEADRMLDMGFIHDVKRIISFVPKQRQTLFFSATMPTSIRKFANTLLYKPIEINVNPVSSTAPKINQAVYFVEKAEKTDLLINILKDKSIDRSLVFTRTKHGADRLTKQLLKTGIQAAAIHGNKTQNARQTALQGFRSNKLRVLVATDIAARGIDIEELAHVVNYEIPEVPETYVHRIGRTGRAGAAGVAISFCNSEEKPDLRSIQKLIGFEMPVLNY